MLSTYLVTASSPCPRSSGNQSPTQPVVWVNRWRIVAFSEAS